MSDLAPLFAQVREAIEEQVFGSGYRIEILAALSAIERHVQDMEKALGLVVDYDEAVKEWDGIDALTDMNAKQIASHEASRLSEEAFAAARAALPAREKGTASAALHSGADTGTDEQEGRTT